MGNVQEAQCNTSKKLPSDVPEQNTWMAEIDDNSPLTLLSIPGTHCSCSAISPYLLYRHQKLDISYALRAGIRYFDVQLKLEENSQLTLCEYTYTLEKEFNYILEPLVYFVTLHPSEVIFCSLQEAYTLQENVSFSDVVYTEIQKFVPETCFWQESELPGTMREARGKIIFLRDFPDGKGRLVPFNKSVCSNREKEKLNSKVLWGIAKNELLNARVGGDDELHITYLSREKMYGARAKKINKFLLDFLNEKHAKRRWGIIAMDFPGSQLISLIIHSNEPWERIRRSSTREVAREEGIQ